VRQRISRAGALVLQAETAARLSAGYVSDARARSGQS
jgi:hypothetical protein